MPQTPSYLIPGGLLLYDLLTGQRLSLRSGAASATQTVGRSIQMTAARPFLLAVVVAMLGCAESTPPQQSQPAPTNRNTVAQVCQITAEFMGVKESAVKPNTSLADLGADELDTVELVMELEDHFNVSIPDEAITNVAGNDNWQTGIGKLTMTKLADIVDKQKR